VVLLEQVDQEYTDRDSIHAEMTSPENEEVTCGCGRDQEQPHQLTAFRSVYVLLDLFHPLFERILVIDPLMFKPKRAVFHYTLQQNPFMIQETGSQNLVTLTDIPE
jgi:hypothetical protein